MIKETKPICCKETKQNKETKKQRNNNNNNNNNNKTPQFSMESERNLTKLDSDVGIFCCPKIILTPVGVNSFCCLFCCCYHTWPIRVAVSYEAVLTGGSAVSQSSSALPCALPGFSEDRLFRQGLKLQLCTFVHLSLSPTYSLIYPPPPPLPTHTARTPVHLALSLTYTTA